MSQANEPSINDALAYPKSLTLMIRASFDDDGVDLALSSVNRVPVATVLFLMDLIKKDLLEMEALELEGDFLREASND